MFYGDALHRQIGVVLAACGVGWHVEQSAPWLVSVEIAGTCNRGSKKEHHTRSRGDFVTLSV
eukprot:2759504-Rhodomonas_salina.1